MRVLIVLFLSSWIIVISGCSPVKTTINNQYQLSAFSAKQVVSKPRDIVILITTPEAVAGYQTEQMLYVKKAFQVEPFAKSAWVSPPGDMLYPLIVQSLQKTGYFFAVTSSPYVEEADYRLDTELLNLEQNFLKKPSIIDFSAKVVLTHIKDNRVLASRIINLKIPCPMDNPYGGVIAANRAVLQFTQNVTDFVIGHIKHDTVHD